MDQPTCVVCAKPLTGEQTRVCGKRCSRRLYNAKARGSVLRPPITDYRCAQCGKVCIPGVGVPAQASKFCGAQCKKRLHRQYEAPYQHRRRRRAERKLAMAAKGTSGAHSSGDHLVNVWLAGSCAHCMKSVLSRQTGGRPSRQFCSDQCCFRFNAHHARVIRRGWEAEGEAISRVKVFKRDGWRCGLCGKMTRRTAKVPHPLAPTLDHIIPRAKGGAHILSNVQCAHFGCNWKKADGALGPEQLRLIG